MKLSELVDPHNQYRGDGRESGKQTNTIFSPKINLLSKCRAQFNKTIFFCNQQKVHMRGKTLTSGIKYSPQAAVCLIHDKYDL